MGRCVSSPVVVGPEDGVDRLVLLWWLGPIEEVDMLVLLWWLALRKW